LIYDFKYIEIKSELTNLDQTIDDA